MITDDIMSYVSHEPEDAYHARSKTGEYLSSHMLAEFVKMPARYHAITTGHITQESRPEFAFGSAAHKMILEGREAFNEAYTVSDGPINLKTGKAYGKDTKAYQEWLSEQNQPVVTTDDWNEITAMRTNVFLHLKAMLLLASGTAEAVVRAELEGVPCQIRIDFLSAVHGIVDLKTCRDIRLFDKDCRDYGYAYQLAFYRAVLRAATGITVPVHIIAVDKTELHVCGVWQIPEAELDVAERINAAAIRRLKECRQSGIWPTGFEEIQTFSLNKI